MKFAVVALCFWSVSKAAEVRLTDLDPPEAQQYIDKQDTSLKYAPKIESNVPAVRFLGNEPHNVLEDIYLANQYHGQDGLGGYLYGYGVPDIAKTERKKAGGDLRGAYNYIAGDGQEIKVEYWDDGTGFHQIDNVPKIQPKQIEDSPEVKAAKDEHLRRWQEEAQRNSQPIANPYNSQGNYANGVGPQSQQPHPGQNVQYYQDQQYQGQQSQSSGQYQAQSTQTVNKYQPQPIQTALNPNQTPLNQAGQNVNKDQSQPVQNVNQRPNQNISQPPQSQLQSVQNAKQRPNQNANQPSQPQPQAGQNVNKYQSQPVQNVNQRPNQNANQPSQPQPQAGQNVDPYQAQAAQSVSQYRAQQQQDGEDSGEYDPKLYEQDNEDEKGPPKGFFYSFDYPVGIIVKTEGAAQKRETDVKDIYASNKAEFEKQLQAGARPARSPTSYLYVKN